MKQIIKQKDLAEAAGIHPVYLSSLLSGRRGCSRRIALRLESVTGISRNIWIWDPFLGKKMWMEQNGKKTSPPQTEPEDEQR